MNLKSGNYTFLGGTVKLESGDLVRPLGEFVTPTKVYYPTDWYKIDNLMPEFIGKTLVCLNDEVSESKYQQMFEVVRKSNI